MQIRVVIRPEMLRDGLWWIAQGLEYDLAVQARSPRQAQIDFVDMIQARIAFAEARSISDPMAGIPPAPMLRLQFPGCPSVEPHIADSREQFGVVASDDLIF